MCLSSYGWMSCDFGLCVTLHWLGNVCTALPWGYKLFKKKRKAQHENIPLMQVKKSLSLSLSLPIFSWVTFEVLGKSEMKKSPEWVFLFLNSPWCVRLHLIKRCWKAQSIHTSHIFMHWHIGSAKQRLRGRGLWNDNARSSSSRQKHPLLSTRNVLTNRGRPQCQSTLLLYYFFKPITSKLAM